MGSTCAISVVIYTHCREPICPADTQWEQQHSPSEQHKGNWVVPGEPRVQIWSDAPAPWESVGLLEEQSHVPQETGEGRKSEQSK